MLVTKIKLEQRERRYYKIVAICLILVLSLSVLSACKGGGDADVLFQGGGSGPIQNTDTPSGEIPSKSAAIFTRLRNGYLKLTSIRFGKISA